ncbi:MAG: nuclear transport factor 2 family protein [Actinomycetota bacterium]
MSQENVEIVRRLYEAQDADEALSLFDPSVVITNVAGAPETAPYIGHAGVRKWVEVTRDAIGDFRIEADEVIDVDENRVIVVGRVCGQGPSSGLAFELQLSTVYSLRRGKIVESRAYRTKNEALDVVGLQE